MPEEVKTEVKKEEPKKKGPLGKLKEKAEDSEEQLAIVSTFVRLGILIWSGGILTLNYVTIPGFPQGKIDPTFIASVFTGVLATFGVQTAKNKNGGTNGGGASGAISKSDMEKLIERASQTAPAQTIRIEQAPLQIGNQGPAKSDDSYKM
jgi:hypothetical protein|tara:strand:- start:107 stop:556 length:450 start_codon:yes stop_codon:yes gene_type:complete